MRPRSRARPDPADNAQPTRAPGSGRHAGRGVATALVLYSGAALLLLGLPALSAPAARCVCSGTDPALYIWGLAWWPHALAHGLDPLHTSAIFAPAGADLGPATTVPGPSLLAAPLTAAFGATVSYDLLAVAAPALGASFAFLLCRRLTGRFGPSLVGGWLFGFSSYELGQLTTHLNLALDFLLPALALLVLRAVVDEQRGPIFAALAAAALLGQLSISTEMLFTATLIGAVTLAAAWAFNPPLRGAIASATWWLLVAYAAMALIALPYLLSALGHGGPVGVGAARQQGADLLSWLLPTRLAALGGTEAGRVAPGTLAAGFVESGVYLGAPLVAILVIYWSGSWRRPAARVLLVVFATASILALGSWLRIDGHALIPLPWIALARLPLFDAILPIRLGAYAALAAAVAAALWLCVETPVAGRLSSLRWALAGAAMVALLPALGHGYWSSRPGVPSFFAGGSWRKAIGAHDIALVLPDDDRGAAMLWQAKTHIGFSMAGGYLGENGRDPEMHEPLHAAFASNGPSGPDLPGELADFATRHRVSVIVVDSERAGPWPAALAERGLQPRRVGGILLYRLAPRSRGATASTSVPLSRRAGPSTSVPP